MNQNTRNLTEKQVALVDTLVANACTIKEASQIAGYAEGESGRVSASKALKQPHVQQYLLQSVANSLSMHATSAVQKIVSLSGDARSEYVQLEASKDILDRVGLKSPDKQVHLHTADVKVSIDLS
tara:strand:- start:1087 stop:1461 length:375 start_codon:yes stop_codon:yes gene_type:complete